MTARITLVPAQVCVIAPEAQKQKQMDKVQSLAGLCQGRGWGKRHLACLLGILMVRPRLVSRVVSPQHAQQTPQGDRWSPVPPPLHREGS